MRTTLQQVRALATRLGISYGELLRLAREHQQDGAMPSLAHLHGDAMGELYDTLMGIHARRAMAHNRNQRRALAATV